MNAAVLSIGTELTRGELVNGNAAWLGEQLTLLGLDVVEHVVVDDDERRIVAELRRLGDQVKVLVATGGLGPTTDDLTTQAVAKALGVGVFRDEASLERIRQRWASFGRPMPESNVKQAEFPEGAEILPNPGGTAPGFAVQLGDARSFFLPGVPAEMRQIFQESIVPAVAPLVKRTAHQIHLRTFGMTESQLGEILAPIEREHEGLVIGYRAHFPEIEVKVFVRADDEVAAEAGARRAAAKIRERLGDTVYGEREETFAGSVGRILRDRRLTLAVAESCTGGMIGEMLTTTPGSSDYFLLDAVVYSNAAKSKVLGVSTDTLRAYGAVSSECAAAMAEGALRLAEADLAVSVTGIAGPGGGTDDKPVGTVWFGLSRRGGPTVTKRRMLPGDRERIRTLSAYVALKMVARAASGASLEDLLFR